MIYLLTDIIYINITSIIEIIRHSMSVPKITFRISCRKIICSSDIFYFKKRKVFDIRIF